MVETLVDVQSLRDTKAVVLASFLIKYMGYSDVAAKDAISSDFDQIEAMAKKLKTALLADKGLSLDLRRDVEGFDL